MFSKLHASRVQSVRSPSVHRLRLVRLVAIVGEMGSGYVLVVDDNAENRALAQATLEDEGYTLELASTGEEGIDAFARRPPDCVLLDIRMPGMDGITTCQRMRALPGADDIPIVFLTAERDVDTFDRAQAAGSDDYVTKPVRPTELVTRVASAVKQRRMAAERDELYVQLRRQRDDLMRLQLQKEALTAFLVHDLKNPVNAIELQAQRVLRDSAASDKSRDAATKIREEARSLLSMIVNLLDVSKADEGRLDPAPVPIEMGALLADICRTMQARAGASRVSLRSIVDDGVVAYADPDLLRRVVDNLVDNALRHAPEDSEVMVRGVTLDGGTRLTVADAGAGVAEDQRTRVFERFTQGEAFAGHSNRGLGLTFCKLAVEAHRGRIWLEDAAPGAIFCVWLPDAAT